MAGGTPPGGQYAADKREYARELEAFRERYPAEAAALAAKRRTVPATAAAPRRPRTAAAGAAGATELEPDPTGVTGQGWGEGGGKGVREGPLRWAVCQPVCWTLPLPPWG